MLETIVFVVASGALVYISRASLLGRRSHGFYRFFSWECLLVLFLVNVDVWFHTPFAPHQILSWLMLIVSMVLVIHGVALLRRIGKPDETRDDTPMIGFEKTTTLVTEGAYRYIRHPLYSSLFFLGWGIFFKDPSWLGGALAVAATGFLVATARIEEAENVRFFGPAYQEYIGHTRMFVPFLF
jgi:protein-S-isoprenylcysteine O-methyltransferase Ste14